MSGPTARRPDRRGEPRTLRVIVLAWLVALGSVMVAGGPERMSAPAWGTLARWAAYAGQPVHHLGYGALLGAVLLVAGALLPSLTLRFAAYIAAAVMSWTIAVGNAAASLSEPTASQTGIATYGVLALPLCVWAAVLAGRSLLRQNRGPIPATTTTAPAPPARDRTDRGEQ